ncbi:Protein of unknown function DUF262 [Clostridium sp. DSM 8431]|uniref:DUF262 domain-containing protein n=1 Tax=Clostridium sp. DSM 8431 TaxID=1761781 RepID=UPI0008EDCE88|nr:DUF262 domain-containing protein [Clostridium sp. DSM 8431]SFU55338.1 Protein of unknown function DUF262 [Clostridium sp. DSM 8431]
MKYRITELEIESIYRRIVDNEIDLQPDFQRGEVWSAQRKRKLIDTILREWQVPPIHLVQSKDYSDEVLDGQQRLVSIREFMDNKLKVDGGIKPFDKNISELNGFRYKDLPEEVKRRFKKYTIRLVRIEEYSAEEAAELFYRLNQQATLTSAEQRNAFFGETRSQVKKLVRIFENNGANRDTIGFSNSRMAYDDIIAKFCYTLEIGTLKKKINSSDISDKYRGEEAFSNEVYERSKEILLYFIDSMQYVNNEKLICLNKATLYSWLIFANRMIHKCSYKELGDYIYRFEIYRERYKQKEVTINLLNKSFFDTFNELEKKYSCLDNLLILFNQKSSLGSTEVTSIIIRDIIINLVYEMCNNHIGSQKLLSRFEKLYEETNNVNKSIDLIAEEYNWGEIL